MNIEDLKEHGALLEGHFELSSGLHSDKYIQCAKLLQTSNGMNLVRTEVLKKTILDTEIFNDINVVIGGAYGGIRFASIMAWLICEYYQPTRGIWCERVSEITQVDIGKVKIFSGNFQLRRGFEIKKGEKVLIAEDVTTTGKSIGEVAGLVKEHDGEIVGAISIIDRRQVKVPNNTLVTENEGLIQPFISLVQLDINTWNPEKDECPLCKDNSENKLKLIKPGSKK